MPAERATMFLGCQFSLYPMTNDFVDVILGSVKALDPYRGKLRIETDDLSTLIVGDSEAMFDALRDCFVEAAGRCGPVVMRSEEHTSELQSLMRISYAAFCLNKTTTHHTQLIPHIN